MENKCLYCLDPVDPAADFHEKCSLLFFGSRTAPQIPYTIGEMADLAKNVVERSVSVPGVQAKLSMSIVLDTFKNADKRLTIIDALGGAFILKPPSEDFPELPQNEHATMRIAEAFGINVVPSSLIKLQSGELSYITKRIDRTDTGKKIHMLDMFQITEAVDKYRSSLEKIGKALSAYSSNPMLDKLFFFEISLFCFLVGNNDMHLKNFSMIQTAPGWTLAPCYDLLSVAIALPEDTEELALTLEGKKKKLKREHFIRLGEGLGLTNRQIEGVFKRFLANKQKAESGIRKSLLSEELKQSFLTILNARYDRIYDNQQ